MRASVYMHVCMCVCATVCVPASYRCLGGKVCVCMCAFDCVSLAPSDIAVSLKYGRNPKSQEMPKWSGFSSDYCAFSI
jgi:hypothetical protein